MSLYPSLEDMKVDQLSRAQNQAVAAAIEAPSHGPPDNSAYPNLGDYMGLELSESVISANMPEYLALALQPQAVIS